MKAYVFPGQGAQFIGMGKDLYENSSIAKELFEQANQELGFRITGSEFLLSKNFHLRFGYDFKRRFELKPSSRP